MISTDRIRQVRDRARLAVEARNGLSTWTVTRPGDGGTTDPITGDWTPGTETVWVGDGFYSDSSRPHVRVRTDAALTVEGPTFCVGHDAPRFRKGDTVAAVTCDDLTLLERSWRITGEPGSSYAVHRHYPLEEVTS